MELFDINKFNQLEKVVNKDGEEINMIKSINIEALAKYVDQHERIGVRITEGNEDSEYNSWQIYTME